MVILASETINNGGEKTYGTTTTGYSTVKRDG